MVVGAYIFIDLYHDTVFVCKIKHYSLFYEIDFLYLSIEIIEYKQSYIYFLNRPKVLYIILHSVNIKAK